MADPRTGSFFARIRGQLGAMHPSERRLAETILSFPGEIASYSATELARLAGVSNATVTRFVRRLGYTNFDAARQAARAAQQGGAAVFRVARDHDGPEAVLAAHLAQGHLNIENSFKAITLTEIDALADGLMAARRIWVLGFRTSQGFAVYLGAQIGQTVSNVTLLPQAGQTLAESLCSIAPEDVVIVFALRRTVRSLPGICRALGELEARRALITDLGGPQADEEQFLDDLGAHWRLHVQTNAPGPLFNHAAVLALCHILATRLMERSGAAGRKRLLAIEAVHDSLNEL